jgi:hypothetical protein
LATRVPIDIIDRLGAKMEPPRFTEAPEIETSRQRDSLRGHASDPMERHHFASLRLPVRQLVRHDWPGYPMLARLDVARADKFPDDPAEFVGAEAARHSGDIATIAVSFKDSRGEVSA